MAGVAFLSVACAAAGAFGSTLGGTPGYVPPANSIGLNVGILADIYQELPFVDVMKETQPWTFQPHTLPAGVAPSGVSALDANGWPVSIATNNYAQACAFWDKTGLYPSGVYTILYDGTGTISMQGPVKVLTNTPGQMTVQITPVAGGQGPCIAINASNTTNPIHNIRWIMPGFLDTYQTQPFYPPFLAEYAPFKVIRFLDWSRVNRSDVVNWADRRPVTYASQAMSVAVSPYTTPPVTYRDVALEYQIQLANTLGVNPWFLVPIMASDDYITQMATLVHNTLRPDLHPMIELSNEIWNTGFTQYQYCQQMGTALNLAPKGPAGYAGYYWYAMRTSQMFTIWNNVYGADAGKITHVVSGEQGFPGEGAAVLGYNNLYLQTDLYAVGAYLDVFDTYKITNPSTYATYAAMTVPQVEQTLQANIPAWQQNLAAHAAIAAQYGVALGAYESGVSFEAENVPSPYQTPITNLFTQVTHDPGIGPIYTQMLQAQQALGFTVYNHFFDTGVASVYGSYGLLDYQMQPLNASYKYMAISNFIQQAPPASQ